MEDQGKQLSHHRSSIRKVAAPFMQLHHCDRNDLAGSQCNLQQELRPADGAEGAASSPGPPQEQQPWWEAAEASGQEACPQGAEVAAAQLLPPAEGQQTLQPTAPGSAGMTPLLCVTPVTGHCHTATSPGCPQQRGHFSCARARGCLLPSTGRPSPCQCHLITTQGQPLPPLGSIHRPQAKHICKFVPAGTSLRFMQPGS